MKLRHSTEIVQADDVRRPASIWTLSNDAEALISCEYDAGSEQSDICPESCRYRNNVVSCSRDCHHDVDIELAGVKNDIFSTLREARKQRKDISIEEAFLLILSEATLAG